MAEIIVDEKAYQVEGEMRSWFSDAMTIAREVEVVDDASLSKANEFNEQIKKAIKRVDVRRREFTDHLNIVLKNTNAVFKPVIEYGESVSELVRTKMRDYMLEKEARLKAEQEAQRKIEMERLEARQKEMEALAVKHDSDTLINEAVKIEAKIEQMELKPIEVKNIVRSEAGSITLRKTWTYEVINQDLVPRDFMSPDDKKIMFVIKNGCKEIAGLRIFEEASTSSRK